MRKLLYDDIISFDTCEPNEVAQMISKLDYINKHTREGVHYHEPTRDRPNGWYQVSLPNRRQPLRRVDKKALIDEAYRLLKDNEVDYRFGAVFERAMAEKLAEGTDPKTVTHTRSVYKNAISDELAQMDVRTITTHYVKSYLKAFLEQKNADGKQVTKKYFLAVKGVFNEVFNYALDGERRWIEFNPALFQNRNFLKFCKPEDKQPEHKAFQPSQIALLQQWCWDRIKRFDYDVNAFAVLLACETGMRSAEICALKWEDIWYAKRRIHIHSQLLKNTDGWYVAPWTKNEKGVSQGGRVFPFNPEIEHILAELKANQERLDIESEFVFCQADGSHINTSSYEKALWRICTTKLNLPLSNNHGIRMYLNSYILVPMGITVADRAKMLGHSVEVNLNHYTFAIADDDLDDITDLFYVTQRHTNVIDFSQKKKAPSSVNSRALI